MRIAPSILAADLADLSGALAVCERGGADLVHFDVMDGHFVPNLSFGIPVLAALKRRTALPLDVHLMVTNPGDLLDAYLAAGAASVAVHWEVVPHLDRLLDRIRSGGARAGVAINPATPVELLIDSLPRLDYVLLMSVNPGFSGQAFLPRALDKARRLRRLLVAHPAAGAQIEIGIDGGIGRDNIRAAAEAGIDFAVAGTSVFGAPDPASAIGELRRLAEAPLRSEPADRHGAT
ncbi:MAG TPA: ribulose-phosphate 3-epimerase [Thermoanaerobaculia bacterium]|jgi:ribulose-phosphate 3-epimerase|nr:ribulose-phosphate 3-epimerase [Thermoanaerobaculia bacterium]